MRIYDITHPVQPGLAAWPGDVPYKLVRNASLKNGDSVNLSSVEFSVHIGTHADAPYHYTDAGDTIDALNPETYLGPARVVEVSEKQTIRIEDLNGIDLTTTPRLLLKTSAWPDPRHFPDWIPTIAPDVPAYLQAQGVILLGLDVPSVDALDSKDLPNHHALGRSGIAILESLALADVPPGPYELICLPMKLVGADGAPVRALLRQWMDGSGNGLRSYSQM